jgi:DNA-binding NarL/FixJ family response regulator
MSKVMKILLASSQSYIRRSLKDILRDNFDDTDVSEATDVGETLRKIREYTYDVVLIDMAIKDIGGLEAVKRIKSYTSKCYVLLFGTYDDINLVVRAIRSGACGYLSSQSLAGELIDAVRAVSLGEKYLSPSIADQYMSLQQPSPGENLVESLSDREYEVMLAIVSGKTIKKIATEMFLSPKTVSTYHSRILEKMGLENDTELIRYGLENRLLQSETAISKDVAEETPKTEESTREVGILSRLRGNGRLLGIVSIAIMIGIILGFVLPGLYQPSDEEIEEVNFADSNLEAALRQASNMPQGPIEVTDLESIIILEVAERGITDLSGLEYCTNLKKLSLQGNGISNIESLGGLSQLQELNLDYNFIIDISPLTGLTNLWELKISNNLIVDLSPLAGLTNLKHLHLNSNNISDLSQLSSLTGLEILLIAHNDIADLSPLENLTNLEDLIAADNAIIKITPLENLNNLQLIHLQGNNISDISALRNLTGLREILLSSNQISDILPLVENNSLSGGDVIFLEFNPLSTLSLEDYIPQLQQQGVSIAY